MRGMLLIRTRDKLKETVGQWHGSGEDVALVPTMGALHDGHLSLVDKAAETADRVIVSIFVNPKQFAAHEDFGKYPRTEEDDLEALHDTATHAVYAPSPDEMYGTHFATAISITGPAKAGLEDKFRPHFFDGVATVVTKLFTQSNADYAIFGEKDYQQLLVVRRLAEDLDLGTKVVGIPTLREDDGLAMSSRNRYLTKHERNQAPAINRSLNQAAEKIRAGIDIQSATRMAARSLTTLGFKVDYLTARNAHTLGVPASSAEPLRLLCAAVLGKTRLIDNIAVDN
jgi:pantoate--beta-alanine ligase